MPANLLVVQGGDMIMEHYAPGNDRDNRGVWFSVTKSVGSMLIGAAVAGGLNDLDLVRYLGRRHRERKPGEVFNYNTGKTSLVDEILRSAMRATAISGGCSATAPARRAASWGNRFASTRSGSS